MQKIKTQKNLFAIVFSLAYLFVALFSQNFHNHGSGLFFKDFQFKKTENLISKVSRISGNEDCLSCHVLNEGNTLLPKEFNLNFKACPNFWENNFNYSGKFSFEPKSIFYLRGPPVFI